MIDKSLHLESLERLQCILDNFDMAFNVSNKLFRLAIVSEIIDTTCLFEQLLDEWSIHLPMGEGPDRDVDFSLWKEISTWDSLMKSAQENACIDTTTIDWGNGFASDIKSKHKKLFTSYSKKALKSSHYRESKSIIDFLKFLEKEESNSMDYGNIIYYAILNLCTALIRINELQNNPPKHLFSDYYERQWNRFSEEIKNIDNHIHDIIKNNTNLRRKANGLRSLKDELRTNLTKSPFIEDLKNTFNSYDIEDYRNDNSHTDYSDDYILEELALSELLENVHSKETIAKYIYEHRKKCTKDDACNFVLYMHFASKLDNLISSMDKNVGVVPIIADTPHDKIIKALNEQTKVIAETADAMKTIASRPTVGELILEQNNHGINSELESNGNKSLTE